MKKEDECPENEIDKMEITWICRFHPTEWFHEVGCSHKEWTKEELQQALISQKKTVAYHIKKLGTGHIVKQELTEDEPRVLYQCKSCSVRCQALIPEVCDFIPERCLDKDISKNWVPEWVKLTALKETAEGKC